MRAWAKLYRPGLRHLAHQGNRRRGIENVEQVVLAGLRGPGQQVEIEVPADDRRHREHPPGFLPQSPDPRPDHLAHTVGQGRTARVRSRPPTVRWRLGRSLPSRQMTQHLAHEERVAIGLPVHGVGQADAGVVEALTGCGLQERHHPVVVEPGQLDAGHPAQAMEGRQACRSGGGL